MYLIYYGWSYELALLARMNSALRITREKKPQNRIGTTLAKKKQTVQQLVAFLSLIFSKTITEKQRKSALMKSKF